jgi:hypothetical protein
MLYTKGKVTLTRDGATSEYFVLTNSIGTYLQGGKEHAPGTVLGKQKQGEFWAVQGKNKGEILVRADVLEESLKTVLITQEEPYKFDPSNHTRPIGYGDLDVEEINFIRGDAGALEIQITQQRESSSNRTHVVAPLSVEASRKRVELDTPRTYKARARSQREEEGIVAEGQLAESAVLQTTRASEQSTTHSNSIPSPATSESLKLATVVDTIPASNFSTPPETSKPNGRKLAGSAFGWGGNPSGSWKPIV